MTTRSGSTLVAALLVSVVLLLAGMGFLGQRPAQQRAVKAAILKAQARGLAEAGLEEAFQKLSKDSRFPPLDADAQTLFTYRENVLDGAGVVLGAYQVTVDVTHRRSPYSVIKLTCVGEIGPSDAPSAVAQLFAELDVSPTIRGTGTVNPDFFRLLYIRWGQSF